MKPVEPAAGMAEESEVAKRLAVGSIHDPHHVIHDVRMYINVCSGRKKVRSYG